MIRIVLADDRRLFRTGLRRLLADVPDVRIVAETSTGPDLIERAGNTDADVVVLGVSDNWPHVITVIPALVRARLRVLVLATDPVPVAVERAERAGATGTLTTDATAEELAEAVRLAASGHTRPGRAPASGRQDGQRPLPELSGREYEVMRMLGGGQTVNQIADRLGLSPKTVGTYRSRVMEKLGLGNTAELVRFVLERGLAD